MFLIDEVLTVGDIAFQHKCFERVVQFSEQGGAIGGSGQWEDDRVISNHQHLANYYLGEDTIQLGHIEIPDDIVELPSTVWSVQGMTLREDFPGESAPIESSARLVSVFDNQLYGRNFVMRVYYYEPDS